MGSQPGGGHSTPLLDWIAVYVMLAGCVLLGLAMPMKSWILAIVGGVLLLAGGITALAYGIMNHTEDYEVRPRGGVEGNETEDERPHRIISA